MQALNFKSDSQFTSHPLFKQPAGVCLSDMRSSFDEIHKMISLDTLPTLRTHVALIQSNKAQLDKNIEKNIDFLKNSLQTYHNKTNNNTKSKPSDMLTLVEKQCSPVGSKQYQFYYNVVSEIDSVEILVNNDLDDEHKCLIKMKECEDKYIIGAATRIQKSLPFMDLTVVKRVIEDTNSVSYFRYFIAETFLELKCHFSQHKMPPKESAARTWITEDEVQPFYARVWVDRAPENKDELQVYKKETVKVTQAGFSDYWIVQNTDIKCGYVPTDILEPIS